MDLPKSDLREVVRVVGDSDPAGVRRILVANSKGGCGKTTVATNLASFFSSRDLPVALFDYDPQGSSMQWLALREREPAIHGVSAHRQTMVQTRAFQRRIPEQTRCVILDAPAGVSGTDLVELIRQVDTVLIPVLPSPFDMQAAAGFIRDLLLIGRVRAKAVRIGAIANRVRTSTKAFHALQQFLERLDVPVVGQIRDTQLYLQAAEDGLGICELRGTRTDTLDWKRIAEWIDSG